MNITLDVPKAGDFGAAMGAARLGMMAATGAGAEIAAPPPIARSVTPNHTLISAFADQHERYRTAYTLLKDH